MTICEWNWTDIPQGAKCKFEAWYLIIFGCLNGHINEMTVCTHHRIMWDDAAASGCLYCPECYLMIAEWEGTRTNGLINYRRPSQNWAVKLDGTTL